MERTVPASAMRPNAFAACIRTIQSELVSAVTRASTTRPSPIVAKMDDADSLNGQMAVAQAGAQRRNGGLTDGGQRKYCRFAHGAVLIAEHAR